MAHDDEEDLDLPPDLYVLRPGEAAELAARPPFPAEWLLDRDYDLGQCLRFIEEEGDRRLYAMPRLALLWMTERDGQVVKIEVLEGQAAARAWIARGMRLEPPLRERIMTAVRPGVDLHEALVSVFGRALRLVQELDHDGAVTTFAIHTDFPARSAVLEVDIEAGARVRAARLLEGRAAWERLRAKAIR